MNPSTSLDCPAGVPSRQLPGSFVRLHVAASADACFELVYPGAVLRSDGVYALSVIAAQMLVLPGDAPVRYAVVHLGISDQRQLARQLERQANVACGDAPSSFALAVSAEGRSFGDVVAAGEAGAGCGCGGAGGIGARAELLFGAGGDVERSQPIRAMLRPKMSRYAPAKGSAQLPLAAYLFDCHSEWQGIPGTGHWTYCRGPCKAGETCVCDYYPKPSSVCDGWDFCDCD